MIFLDANEAVAEMRKHGFDTVRCCDCKYWVAETHGCTRHPSIEPWWETDYCSYGEKMDEVTERKCDTCYIAQNYNLEDDDSPCLDCEEVDG